MSVYEKAKPLVGTSLNYEIVDNVSEYPIGIKNLFWNFNLTTGTASTSNGVSYTLNTNQWSVTAMRVMRTV